MAKRGDPHLAARQSDYKPEFAAQATHLCRLGATDDDLAAFFGKSQRTINYWKTKHPGFAVAVQEAKDEADAKVVKSLYQRALGYAHNAVKIFNHDGKAMKIEYIEQYPPDTTACIFWLKNRQPENWRDKTESEITHKRGVADLTNDELMRIATGGGAGDTTPTPSASKPPRVH